MAIAVMSWLLAIPLLGLTTGLRSMTPMAVICWFAYLGYLPVDGTWAWWTARLWAAVIITVLAVAELVVDKLPRCPNRTSPGPLFWRLILGGMAGSIAATAMAGPGVEGVLSTAGRVFRVHDPARPGGEVWLLGLADCGGRRPVCDRLRGVRDACRDELRAGCRSVLPWVPPSPVYTMIYSF